MSMNLSTLALVAASVGAGDPHSNIEAGAAAAGSPSAEVEALRAQVAALEEKMEVLTGEPAGGWLSRDEEAVRALIHDVMAESQGRTSWRQDGLSAGHDGKFYLASPDGAFRLNIEGQIQVRYVFNQLDEEDADTDGSRGGFEIRRSKLSFGGHVFDDTIEYKIKGGFERSGGAFILEDSYIAKSFDNGWSVRGGQFKGPFMAEELASSSKQLAVERSLVNEEFNQDYSQGVELAYEQDRWRAMAMFGDGFGSDNTSALAEDTEYAFTGRAEILLAGESWKQFGDFTSWRDDDFGFLLGGAAHIEEGENGTPTMEDEMVTWTVDGQAEFGGSSLFAAIVGRHMDEAATDDYGAVIQGGFFISDDVELFGRYEWGDLDGAEEDLSVATIGFNKYLRKHALKWTTDFGYAFDEVDADWSSSGAGWRGDEEGADSQWVLRSQVQLLF